jgi:hypothetical protein
MGDVDKHVVPAVVSEMNRTMQRAIEKLVTPLSAGGAAVPIDGQRNQR